MKEYSSKFHGFNIIEVSKDVWLFEVIGMDTFYGTFKEVAYYATTKYDIELEEIENAISYLFTQENQHNALHFGAMGTFLYSFTYDFVNRRAI